MRKSRIFTHYSLDMDAVFAILSVIKYVFKESFIEFFKDPKWRERIILVPADWDGTGMEEGDIAVDLPIGEKGEIEEGERVNSATLQILKKHAPIEDQNALGELVFYLNEHDATGSAVGSLLGEEIKYRKDYMKIFRAGSIDGMFRAAQANFGYSDSKKVIQFFSFPFDGYLINGKKYLKALEIYPQRVKWHGNGKKKNIAFLDMKDAPLGLCDIAFEKGAEIVIYKNGNDIGIKRRNFSKFPVNHPLILKLIKDAGEEGKWFIHPALFLICTGSNKKHASFQTVIRMDQLIYVVSKAFASYETSLLIFEKRKKSL